MRIHNNNKKVIQSIHKKDIISLYFKWVSIKVIAKQFGYDFNCLQKYLNWSSTKKIISSKWVLYRCNVCRVYKPVQEFCKAKWTDVHSHCKYCARVIKSNKYKIDVNMWNKEIHSNRQKESWKKHWWRYNFRKRIIYILTKSKKWMKK